MTNKKRILAVSCGCVSLFLSVIAVNDEENLKNIVENICMKSQYIVRRPEGAESLRDVLPDIFQHLNIRDLHNVQQVCTDFYDAAKIILARKVPQLRAIPIMKIDSCSTCGRVVCMRKHLSQTIDLRPKIAIFFINKLASICKRYYNYASQELLAHYIPELPPDCTILNILGSQVILENTDVDVEDNQALGLLLPEHNGVSIKEYILRGDQLRKDINFADKYVIDDYFDQIQPELHVHKRRNPYGMIFFSLNDRFTHGRQSFGAAISRRIGQEYIRNSGNFSLWGSTVNFMATAADFPAMNLNIFGATLSGPRVQCWSLLINTGDSEKMIKTKIQKFKNKIDIARAKKSIALSIQNAHFLELQQILIERNEIFKTVFPDLQLMIFGQMTGDIYCLDTVNELGIEEPQISYGEGYICYMIISYF